MKFSRVIYRSILYYKKQHLALLIGTIISTAVLTGALIVGDSVRYSLRSLVDKRLGNAEYVMQTGDRFVSRALSENISEKLHVKTAAILQLNGIAINPENQIRINKTSVLGVYNSFWELSDIKMNAPGENEAYISHNMANKLGLKIEDELLLRVANAEVIPLNAPFAAEKEPAIAIRLTVKHILTDQELGRFSLRSDQKAPYNVFVNQVSLAEKLELDGLVNMVLVEGANQVDEKTLSRSIKEVWTLRDAGLYIRQPEAENVYELLSSRIFIEDAVSNIVQKLHPQSGVLTYLVNSIQKDSFATPYSFVSALSGLGLKDHEMVINSWMADDLNAEIGDTLSIKYYTIGALRQLSESGDRFVVKNIYPVNEFQFKQSLMPEFPGLADAGSCSDWNTGVPINLDKIRDKDEDYWNHYKGTPKALISLKTGQKLWNNKFGQFTSFRFDQKTGSPQELEHSILDKLQPQDLNLSFVNARSKGNEAAKNSVDFGQLFLSLSFFVILAGVLLTTLLFALNTASRSKETAILNALGYAKRKIIKIRLIESSLIIIPGSLLGAGLGILYNQLMLAGLNSIWQDAVHANMLEVHIKTSSLLTGGFSGLLISFLAIYFVTRNQLKKQLAASLKKEEQKIISKRYRGLKWIILTAFTGAAFLVAYAIAKGVGQSASFFLSAGFLFLVSTFGLVSLRLRPYAHKTTSNNMSLWPLALKNLGLNHNRNMTALILLALGTFSILITGANRKTFYGIENNNQSGTGGYLFWVETSMPILYDLKSNEGIERFGLDEELMKKTEILQMHALEGDDASCLNLNQVQNPRMLGLDPKILYQRHSFSFAKSPEGSDKDSGWMMLEQDYGENIYPVVLDQTVLTWGLMKSVGDTLYKIDESGNEIKLLIVGGLENSVFQGNMMVSDKVFEKHFPTASGSRVMLVDAPDQHKNEVYEMLKNQFVDAGIEISKNTQRLAEFNSVTNTYLTVFMMLGGLGVLIGTIGLAIVLLRNLLDRKYELALLKALGFKKEQIFKLILIENSFILLTGLICGLASAGIGMLPSILSPSFAMPLGFIGIIILAILFTGFLSIYFTSRKTIKGNYLEYLRSE